jgi:hypothetical protein
MNTLNALNIPNIYSIASAIRKSGIPYVIRIWLIRRSYKDNLARVKKKSRILNNIIYFFFTENIVSLL